MTDETGTVTIAPEVLMDIVRLTALATPGVTGLSPRHASPVSRLFSGAVTRGIHLEVEDHAVSIDLYVVAERDVELLPLGQALQIAISRGIQDVVGMPVRSINVHFEDVADHKPETAE